MSIGNKRQSVHEPQQHCSRESQMTARVHNWCSPNWSLFRYIFNISNALSKMPLSCWPDLCWNRFSRIPVGLLHEPQYWEWVSFLCTCVRFLRTYPTSSVSYIWIYLVGFSEYLYYYKCIQWHSQQINKNLKLFHCVSLLMKSYCSQNCGCQALTIQHWWKGSIQQ